MKLKSLEISGFKSFADKTVIEFMPGMTGIVGPNGSGKSNIIEAIRWVMGEQSAKDLRGTKMADIIFGGTNARPALNRAEVSMTFDNTDHYIKSDFSEIRITRKLYRSGERVAIKLMAWKVACEIFMNYLWILAWDGKVFQLFHRVGWKAFLMPNQKTVAVLLKKLRVFININKINNAHKRNYNKQLII